MMDGPKVPTERPDPGAAARKPEDGQDRPGLDLGGAVDETPGTGSTTMPRVPLGSPGSGQTATGRASGATNPAGSRPRSGGGSEAGGGPTSPRGGTGS
ncbi:MAG TPA: hypothetical protein VF601_03375 [Beijerinckiaceae bacterium]|jgi:hypothetical protein